MRCVALMPLRGGSKSIPGKNIRPLAGKPLFWWSLRAAVDSGCFDEIAVSTDSKEIKASVHEHFSTDVVRVIERPAELATDTASTESVMIHFQTQAQVSFDVLCLIQATSPFTTAEDFRSAKSRFIADRADSLVTGVRWKRFFWSDQSQPINYDPLHRPRRQEFSGWIMENGAFYFTSSTLLHQTRCRLGGKIAVHEMAEESALELDEPADWLIIEQLLRRRVQKETVRRPENIRALVLDVDGTLTDGGMYYGPEGEVLKKFDTRDAQGIALLRDQGIRVAVITRENSPTVTARMKKLQIEDYYPGVKDKLPLLKKLSEFWRIPLSQVAYGGDDLGDWECLEIVGFSFCPADAPGETKKRAHYVCSAPGGYGAVREVCDLILAPTGEAQ